MALIGVRRALIKPKRIISVPVGTTLDATFNAGSPVVLSNGNLTATGNGSNAIVRVGASHSAGKFYCEVTAGQVSNAAFGLCDASAINTNYLNSNNDSAVATGFGGAWQGASIAGTTTAAALTAGHVYGLAIDITNRAAWVIDITGGSGQWNANATANPATNVNGATMTSPLNTGNLYAACSPNGGGDNFTFNFGSTAYAGTPPAGFGNW